MGPGFRDPPWMSVTGAELVIPVHVQFGLVPTGHPRLRCPDRGTELRVGSLPGGVGVGEKRVMGVGRGGVIEVSPGIWVGGGLIEGSLGSGTDLKLRGWVRCPVEFRVEHTLIQVRVVLDDTLPPPSLLRGRVLGRMVSGFKDPPRVQSGSARFRGHLCIPGPKPGLNGLVFSPRIGWGSGTVLLKHHPRLSRSVSRRRGGAEDGGNG